jgi:DNA-directed RNA polymerase subunit beta'
MTSNRESGSAFTTMKLKGMCKMLWRNLATGKMTQRGSSWCYRSTICIGEPGTQLTLRTFHVGGCGWYLRNQVSLPNLLVSFEIEDLKTVKKIAKAIVDIVVSRSTELKLIDERTGILLSTNNIPYGSSIFVKDGQSVAKGDVICKWDPYNGVIVSEFTGKIAYEDLEQGQSFMVEIDEQTGFQEK